MEHTEEQFDDLNIDLSVDEVNESTETETETETTQCQHPMTPQWVSVLTNCAISKFSWKR